MKAYLAIKTADCNVETKQQPPVLNNEANVEVQETAILFVSTRGWLQKHLKSWAQHMFKSNFLH